MPRIPLIFLLILLSLPATASEPEVPADAADRHTEAARLYADGDWAGAAAKLQQISPGEWTAESLLLLGHALARQGKTAEAMLSYRRTLGLRPGQPEATQNLAVLARRQGVIESPPPSPMLGFLLSIPAEGYLLAATGAFWLSLAGGAGLFFRSRRGLAMLSTLALSTGIPALATVGTAWIVKERAIEASPDSPPRVWLPDGQLMEESPLFSEPARGADRVVETLPPGTPLRLVRMSAWSYVEVPSGNQGPPLRGWIRNPSWLPLRPGDHGSGGRP
jgi:hypothetical protein